MPSTVAETAPLEEPPGVFRVSHGLRVMPVSGLSPTAFQPSSGMAVLPRTMAPCSRSLATAGASRRAGLSDDSLEPYRVGMPATQILSLMPTGMPSARPLGSAAIHRASDSRARASAP